MMEFNNQKEDKDQSESYFEKYSSSSFKNRSFFFIPKVLSRLSSGNFFKRVFSVVLKVVAILVTIGGIVLWIRFWGTIADLGFGGILGGLIFQLIFLAAIYMVVHTTFIRANEINMLADTSFAVIPISSIFLKLLGELYACVQVPMAIAGGIFIWFAGYSYQTQSLIELFAPSSFLYLLDGGSFLDGLIFMIMGVVISFFVLLFFYFLSEIIRLGVDIAHNTGAIREVMERQDEDRTGGDSDYLHLP